MSDRSPVSPRSPASDPQTGAYLAAAVALERAASRLEEATKATPCHRCTDVSAANCALDGPGGNCWCVCHPNFLTARRAYEQVAITVAPVLFAECRRLDSAARWARLSARSAVSMAEIGTMDERRQDDARYGVVVAERDALRAELDALRAVVTVLPTCDGCGRLATRKASDALHRCDACCSDNWGRDLPQADAIRALMRLIRG